MSGIDVRVSLLVGMSVFVFILGLGVVVVWTRRIVLMLAAQMGGRVRRGARLRRAGIGQGGRTRLTRQKLSGCGLRTKSVGVLRVRSGSPSSSVCVVTLGTGYKRRIYLN